MSWTDGYLQASFRDIPFFIRRASRKSGRRNALHIYPRVDDIDHEDMGRQDRTFTLDAYVIGDDYQDQLKSLEDALDAFGTGMLIHPYRGVVRVKISGVNTTESTDEGRMARVSFTCHVQGTAELTKVQPNTQKQVELSKEAVIAETKDWFVDVYSLAGKPASAVSDARDTMDRGLVAIDAAKRIAASNAEFKRELDNAEGDVIALSLNAEFLADEFINLVNYDTDFFSGLATTSLSQTREQSEIYSFAAEPVVNTSALIAEDDDYPSKQIRVLMQYAAVAAQIGLISSVAFDTVSDAETSQKELFSQIDALSSSESIPDDLYAALRDAKKAVYDNLQERVLSLPLLVAYTLPGETNTLSFMFDIYGDIDEEQSFIDRNAIIHPGFVPVGQTVLIKVFDE